MSPRSHPLRWLPPLVVGICAAAAAEIATGLLLYAGPGLLRSLTTVLAVESAALGIGIWTAPGPRPDLVDALRRRWMLCLVAFVMATVFSASWSLIQDVGGSALGQGLGLAFLAGLPLYTCGGVLGAMATAGATDPSRSRAGVGAPAALGAAVGFAATGVSLPRVLTPASLFLVCLVLLSAGGLVYGAVLDSRLRVDVQGTRPSPAGEVRVEDRHLPSRDRAARVLVEGSFVRRWVILDGESTAPWDVTALRLVGRGGGRPHVSSGGGSAPGGDAPSLGAATSGSTLSSASTAGAVTAPPDDGGVLLVGGGASTVPSRVLRADPLTRVTVVERSPEVVELARSHMSTKMGSGGARFAVHTGNVDDVTESLGGSYRAVLVDTLSLGPVGGVAGLSARSRASLCEQVAPGGHLVLGPLAPAPGSWRFPDGWSTASYRRQLPPALQGLGVGITDEEVLLVGRRPGATEASGDAEWPDTMEDFVRDRTGEEVPA